MWRISHHNYLCLDNVQGHKEATIGHYFIYVDHADKIDIKIGSERSSFLKIDDMTTSKYTFAAVDLVHYPYN